MDRRERLQRCYSYQEVDRPAVYCRTSFPTDDPTYDRLKAYLAAHSELKLRWNGRAWEEPYPTEETVEPFSPDWERRVLILHTHAGDLRASWLASLKGQPGLQETYLLKSRDDAVAYLSLPLPELGGAGVADSFQAAERQVGTRGIVDVSLGFNPAGFVAELCGSETFVLWSITERDLLHALCERQMRLMLRAARFLLAEGVGPYFSMAGEEYVVPPLHGPRDFDDFNLRYDKPIVDLLHDAGGRMHIHCHGRIRQVLPSFIALGVDVLHPFEAPPMGDITPAEAKALARGRLCLEGNLQISDMYERTPEEIRLQTQALIAAAFDDHRGLIVCPTASPYIPGAGERCFESCRAMIDTVRAWRG